MSANLGFLRMAVEDAVVAYLQAGVPPDLASVRPSFTTTEIEPRLVVVHAKETAEVNEASTLARYVITEIRCITYAEDIDGGWGSLYLARAAHYELVDHVYALLAVGSLPSLLNALQIPKVSFWQAEHPLTETGGIEGQSFLTTINFQVGATPQET